MSANELAERLQAACWLRLVPEPGEGSGTYFPEGVGYRSAVGFDQSAIITGNPVNDYPIFILLLERELNRKETVVQCCSMFSVDDARSRDNYPVLEQTPLVRWQAMHTAWLGDPATPDWLPFINTFPVPPGFDLDVFNSIAVQPYQRNVDGGLTFPADVSVTVFKLPRNEGPTIVPELRQLIVQPV